MSAIEPSELELKEAAYSIYKKFDDNLEEDLDLEKKGIKKVVNLINDSNIERFIELLTNPEYIDKFNYRDLVELSNILNDVGRSVNVIKEDVELDKFFKSGKIFDFVELKKQFDARHLEKKYPKFNFKTYKRLINNPISEIWYHKKKNVIATIKEHKEKYKIAETFEKIAGHTKEFNINFPHEWTIIKFDPFVVKKFNTAINQMIFNEMDIYIGNVGSEGAGKSCWSSQQLIYLYFMLRMSGLIEYDYDVKKLFFSTLTSLLEEQDLMKNNDYFRLFVLDEAGDLNRQNYREETAVMFKDDMRRSRKLQKITILNLPQLGELDTAITLSRVNFVFKTKLSNKVKTGTLLKGMVDMFIIPRGNIIFSNFQKKNLFKADIKQSLSKQLEKKGSYYLDLDPKNLIHRFKFFDGWGFDKDLYDSFIKTENKTKRLGKGITFSDRELYVFFKKMPELKHWDFDKADRKEKKMYELMKKARARIMNKFEEDFKLRAKMDYIYADE